MQSEVILIPGRGTKRTCQPYISLHPTCSGLFFFPCVFFFSSNLEVPCCVLSAFPQWQLLSSLQSSEVVPAPFNPARCRAGARQGATGLMLSPECQSQPPCWALPHTSCTSHWTIYFIHYQFLFYSLPLWHSVGLRLPGWFVQGGSWCVWPPPHMICTDFPPVTLFLSCSGMSILFSW